MKKQHGFTLIELVVVIIILGILAVTAAPKFINLQSDARVSTLQGLKGALQGANTLVYSKAALVGKEKEAVAEVQIGPLLVDTVQVNFGYLTADPFTLTRALEIDNEWFILGSADGKVIMYQKGSPYSSGVTEEGEPSAIVKECHLEYIPASATEPPQYLIKADDC